MKKITSIAVLGLALTSLVACGSHSNKNTTVPEQKTVKVKKAEKTKSPEPAPNINSVTDDGTKQNLVDTIKTQKRKQYIEYFNSTNETSVNGMKDIEELVNDPSKDFDVTIIVAPGINGEKTKEEFIEWFNQQEHHNFPVTFTDEATLKNYNITTNHPKPIYIDSNGNLNLSARGINARATNEAIKSYMANDVK